MITGVPPLSLAIITLVNRVSVTEPVMVVSGDIAVMLALAVTVIAGELIEIEAGVMIILLAPTFNSMEA
jgi:hypothetical protein